MVPEGPASVAPRTCRTLAIALVAVLIPSTVHVQTADAQKQITDKEVAPVLARCLQCHGAGVQMSNLDLRTREAMLKGGEKGPSIVPGNADASLLFKRISGAQAPLMPMAPVPALNAQEIALIKDWINQGAQWTATSATAEPAAAAPAAGTGYSNGYKEKVIADADRQWWAFQKPVRHTAPQMTGERWSHNPIDGFVRDAQAKKGLEPGPEADRRTLIRRAYLDLLGLLPPPAEVEKFVNDKSPKAWENLIDKLLASSHYGERWGRYWLDVARYADSSGFEFDITVENGWRYRDYVIKAFNEDKPFNQFIVEQLAGDELDKPTDDSLVATTYYRIGPRVRFRELNYPSYRYDYMDDMVRTTFQGFMGLSVNCARCHDHKFDPITRMDYYRAVADFWGYVNYDHPLAPKAKVEEYDRVKKQLEDQMTPLQREIARIEAPYKEKQKLQQIQEALKKFPPDIQEAIKTPEDKRTPGQKLLVAQVLIGPDDADPDQIMADLDAMAKSKALAKANEVFGAAGGEGYRRGKMKLSPEDEAKRTALQKQIEEIALRLPDPLPTADGVRDGDYRLTPDGLGDSHIPGTGRPDYGLKCCYIPEPGKKYDVPPVFYAAAGDDVKFNESTFPVQPGFLQVLNKDLPAFKPDPPKRTDYQSSGRRREMAELIASPDNPLTARVIVNRIWGWHFGRGIVATPGNFGKMGMLPSHPELLDWLATEFVRQGWSIKQMQRLIMTSETYKMASAYYQSGDLEKDPTDVYLWRFPVRRVEAEILRDTVLDASGDLNMQMGGKPFFPSIPVTLRADQPRGTWEVTKEGPDTWRRSVYAYIKRGLKYPMFEVFDEPDLNVTCERRTTSTVPTQALTMLNNEFLLLQANHFAQRVFKQAGTDPTAQVKAMYEIALSRPPSASELDKAVTFLNKQKAEAVKSGSGVSEENAGVSALSDLAHVTLNLNEFAYIE